MSTVPSDRAWWQDRLGAIPDPDGSWRPGVSRPPEHPGVRGEIHQLLLTSYGTELVAEFFRPTSVPSTGVVVVVPSYDTPGLFAESTERTELSGQDPTLAAHGLQLAEVGHAVLAVPWWFEQVATEDPSLSHAQDFAERYGPAAERHRREQSVTPLGRSVADVMLAVTALEGSGLADGARLAAFGHALGGKLTLHLAALDPRIEVAAVHEAGIGFDQPNWGAPWYLDGDVPRDHDQDELLALIAPRPFLVSGGGDRDGEHNLELIREARRHWPDEQGLDLLLHDSGHALPRSVMAGIREWLREQTS
ncbi:hypothetical protein BH708_17545 [Brachybacterium sp. P6-10-X1]|uniref:alpha/beta hydrolase family protein n=1 Tax=Brachybacterium sp. P6-10-X1 TaxID=1903186 RepID=UPI0009717B77|nr:hypothetical protein [Brachybacterium sp. P6-10-X1]APX34209.1 hypothetical protein BH708_17545 [Brachybacterium sp. P6-10-X1]